MLTTLSLTILTVFSFASIAMLLSRIASKRISFFQFFAMSNSLAATHGVKEIRLVANGQGVIPAALAALIRTVRFDDVNGDGRSSGRGVIGEMTGLAAGDGL